MQASPDLAWEEVVVQRIARSCQLLRGSTLQYRVIAMERSDRSNPLYKQRSLLLSVLYCQHAFFACQMPTVAISKLTFFEPPNVLCCPVVFTASMFASETRKHAGICFKHPSYGCRIPAHVF